MADIKISELPVADQANIDDLLEASQVSGPGYVSRHISLDQVATVVADSTQITDLVDDAIGEIPPLTWDNIVDKPATFPPTVPIAWTDISGEPSTYPPSAHSHGAADLPAPPTTLPPSGTAGGDLAGSYPNPLIKPSVTNGQVLTTVAGIAAWAAAAGGGASISIGVTPPGSPTAGALWWNSDATTGGGQLMIFYVDPGGAPGQWVPASPGMSTPTTPGGDFMASNSANITLTGSAVPIVFNTIGIGNSGGWYSTSTGRYVPPVGRYILAYSSRCQTSSAVGHIYAFFSKNGVQVGSSVGAYDAAVGGDINLSNTVEVEANGTDYFELRSNALVAAVIVQASFVAFPISGVKGPPGDPGVGLLQTVSYQTGAVATGSGTIPADDTIPQITEGTEFMTLAITPRSATSKLIIDVTWCGANSVGSRQVVALFQDAAANALAVVENAPVAGSTPFVAAFTHNMISGTTSSTTFRVRAGTATGTTMTFNGAGGARLYGGVMASSIVIQEVL